MRQSPPNKIMTRELEDEIVSLYLSGYSASKILTKIGKFKTRKTIYDILKKYNIDARTKTMRDPNLDHHYFDHIDSASKAYVLGLLIADGWVTKPSKLRSIPQIAFSLAGEDKYMVEWMADQWGTQNKINEIQGEKQKEFPSGNKYDCQTMYRTVVSSGQMYSSLKLLGIDSNKSYISILPPIDNELMSHCLRGIMDGDGVIGSYDTGRVVKFIGTQCLVGQIAFYLHERLGLTYVRPSGRKNRVLASISYPEKDLSVLANYLYKDKESANYLRRKYRKIEDIVN